MFIPFGEWRPDSPALAGATRVAQNCIANTDHYKPFPSLGIVTSALEKRAFGAISFTDKTGVTFTFAGDETKLYKLNAGTFDDVSKAGDYTQLSDTRWEFAKFGTTIIATNYLNNPQYFNTASSSLFDDLAGTPPRAKHVAIVGDFVVLANLVDGTFGVANNGLRWSGINNPATWTPSATTQSDGQLLENGDGGAIQGIVGNSVYGIIIQERCIQRMNYIGSPAVFSFEVVERNRGAAIPNSIVGVGSRIFYIDADGPYMFNGAQSIPIGDEKVSEWFWQNYDNTYKDRVTASIDPLNTVVLWSFPSKAGSGQPDKILAYNWNSNRFTLIDLEVEILFQALTEGLTLEQLDSISTNLDDLPFSLDSSSYTGGKLLSGAFNSDHKAGYFNGAALDAVIESTEFEGAKNRFTEIFQVTPMIEGDDDTVVMTRMGKRDNRTNQVSYSASLSQNNLGRVKTRANARYHRVETTISGGFTAATGIEIDDEFIKMGAQR